MCLWGQVWGSGYLSQVWEGWGPCLLLWNKPCKALRSVPSGGVGSSHPVWDPLPLSLSLLSSPSSFSCSALCLGVHLNCSLELSVEAPSFQASISRPLSFPRVFRPGHPLHPSPFVSVLAIPGCLLPLFIGPPISFCLPVPVSLSLPPISHLPVSLSGSLSLHWQGPG